MKVIRAILVSYLAVMGSMAIFGQDRPGDMPPRQIQRPSTFELVDEVRNSMRLDNKEFDKVYSAYEKYNKSVFGDATGNIHHSMPQGPTPGRNGGMSGSVGGPGGGPGHGGMGQPHGRFGGHEAGVHHADKPKPVDMEKLEKNRTKAEEKLCKEMKKIFKKKAGAYERWLDIRNQQLKKLFPAKPHHTR